MAGPRGSGTSGRCTGPGEAAGLLFALAVGVFAAAPARAQVPAYTDLTQSASARAADLVSRMTLEEKARAAGQRRAGDPAAGRAGVQLVERGAARRRARPAYATVFPQAIGMAATWDAERCARSPTSSATEFRAKYLEERHRFGGSGLVSAGSPSGRPTSTSSAIRAGAAAGDLWRGSVSDRRGWGSPSSRGCRATIRRT